MSSNYLTPKAPGPNKRLKRLNGMFVNPVAYPQLGGFYSGDALKKSDPPMTLEKSPQSRGSKPL